jgi:hypothetical protein
MRFVFEEPTDGSQERCADCRADFILVTSFVLERRPTGGDGKPTHTRRSPRRYATITAGTQGLDRRSEQPTRGATIGRPLVGLSAQLR